ncbi:hypothetical protein MPTK1_5g23770 [Marchantia polymorpha subsp. ruderalis]|uniref:Uncharacterized protein n=2 Tax=Marchantia polymorpha TaxID=3197 RepID=A0AAF6BLL0_MARPO|nr:hypothetical protein MARPO_0010s0078 [Marchantia polymorpha]PTQ46680.1 hypothetical protein MARPO_0010s0079 [Marchantia polymorpha]BBN12894.1 hypothetical protein Mp_5g23770 [Marchantia polymorpha subsp. ruderalis]|eukprot:PTQ46679.1 hypothetical protein MARPO_0010s0078 [Marchantia polymorpha]
MALSRHLCVLLLLAAVTAEAAKIQTYKEKGCSGDLTNTFTVVCNSCQTFSDQSSVKISDVQAKNRISIHNRKNCENYSKVAEIHGGACVNQGKAKIRAVYIAC